MILTRAGLYIVWLVQRHQYLDISSQWQTLNTEHYCTHRAEPAHWTRVGVKSVLLVRHYMLNNNNWSSGTRNWSENSVSEQNSLWWWSVTNQWLEQTNKILCLISQLCLQRVFWQSSLKYFNTYTGSKIFLFDHLSLTFIFLLSQRNVPSSDFCLKQYLTITTWMCDSFLSSWSYKCEHFKIIFFRAQTKYSKLVFKTQCRWKLFSRKSRHPSQSTQNRWSRTIFQLFSSKIFFFLSLEWAVLCCTMVQSSLVTRSPRGISMMWRWCCRYETLQQWWNN